MARITVLFLTAFTFLSITSCVNDFNSTTVTYTKANAIYGDGNEFRTDEIVSDVKDLINPGKVYISEELLLIGEELEGIHVYDNSDPENPNPLSFINIPQNKEFYVHNDIIYAESFYDMVKIDISNKSNPVLVNRVKNAFFDDMRNSNGEILIGFDFEEVTEDVDNDSDTWFELQNSNFVFFDFQQSIIPSSAVPSSFAGSSGSSIGTVNRIAVKDEYVYVISNQNITIFADNGTLEFKSKNQIGWQMETIYPQGDNLFIGTRNSMDIFDITNREHPEQRGSFWHATSCDPVLPANEVAYVTLRTDDDSDCPGDTNALNVIDIRNISNPTQVQEIQMESPFGMTLINNNLYVGEGNNGLKIFDATNPTNLSLLRHDTSVKAYDIIAHPTDANIVLIATPDGFGQYRIESDQMTLLSWIQI